MNREALLKQYERFNTSKQEPLRLEIALTGFSEIDSALADDFRNTLEGQKIYSAYRTYLNKRVRPAVQKISREGRSQVLHLLWKDGVISASVLPELLKMEDVRSNPSVWIQLLLFQNENNQECELHEGGDDQEEQHRSAGEKKSSSDQEIGKDYVDERNSIKIDSHAGKLDAIAIRMLSYSRSVLYELYPFLDAAVAAITPRKCSITAQMGTDGEKLLYSSEFVVRVFRRDPAYLTGLYLHVLLHCLFKDWSSEDAADHENADERIVSIIEKERAFSESTARKVLVDKELMDDHQLWPRKEDQERLALLDQNWNHILQGIGSGNGNAGAARLGIGNQAGTEQNEIGAIDRSNHDYRSFLKSFAVRREEMELDQESFDYIYYTLGMEQYGDLPLIEPLEYKEGHKLEELVIAIDTSGSCSVEMVRRFLQESYQILCEKENFFRRMKVYIIQCDCTVQDVALITSEEDWNNYCKDLKIYGRSGTNFKPVFVYVDRLIEKGELKNLKGLIYFTDGNGTFPTWEPAYQAAFVFVKKDMGQEKLPPWALQLQL